jgi:transcriptional regulator with XRE-family HTH domain
MVYHIEYAGPNAVRRLRERAHLTQKALAQAGGTSQPAIAAYEADQKSPTLETLRRLARSVGYELEVDFQPAMTREERRSLALHRAIAARLADDPARALQSARATLALMRERNPHAHSLLDEWAVFLSRPLPDLLPVLTDASPRGRELRQVTPFAGVLSAAERAAVYGAFAEAERKRP